MLLLREEYGLEKALQLGLIDKIGDLDDAIESASAMADIDNYKVEIFQRIRSI